MNDDAVCVCMYCLEHKTVFEVWNLEVNPAWALCLLCGSSHAHVEVSE